MENSKNDGKKGMSQKTKIIIGVIAAMLLMGVISNLNDEAGNKDEVDDVKEVENTINIAEDVPKQIPKTTDYFPADSILSYIYDNTEFKIHKEITLKVSDFNKNECGMRVEIPEDFGVTANIFGDGICIMTARWLVNNGYDLSKLHVSCIVVTPVKGVTGREGLIRWWGTSTYVYSSDNVKWEWQTTK